MYDQWGTAVGKPNDLENSGPKFPVYMKQWSGMYAALFSSMGLTEIAEHWKHVIEAWVELLP